MKISPHGVFITLFCVCSLAWADQYTGKTVDNGDYYVSSGGTKVSLVRAVEEIGVQYNAKLSANEVVSSVRATSSDASVFFISSTSSRDVRVDIMHVTDSEKTKKSLTGNSNVVFSDTVFINPETHNRLISTNEVIVAANKGVTAAQLEDALKGEGLVFVEKLKLSGIDTYRFRLEKSARITVFSAALAAAKKQGVLYAEPNLIQELQLESVPNDPFFSGQQALQNTGQNGATNAADVNAAQAWDVTTGDPNLVIAILDTGVDVSHSDLTIATNPGETGGGKESNGIDDDGNDLIDDWHGWNFYAHNNNPSDDQGHGTSCAGVAAAIGNNSYGITGIAPSCKILPIKITTLAVVGGQTVVVFAGPLDLAAAINYAAVHADVLSCSWGGGSSNLSIDAAITYATTSGRGGKGCPVFFASCNSANDWNWGGGRLRIPGLPTGSYYIGFRYQKDASGSAGNDASCIDNVRLLNSDGYTTYSSALGTGGIQDFEGGFPPSGWTTLTSTWGAWVSATSAPRVFSGAGGTKSACSPWALPFPVLNNGWVELRSPLLSIPANATLAFDHFVSSQSGDGLAVRLYTSVGGFYGSAFVNGGRTIAAAVAYPASSTDSISVGAATDRAFRATYSEYGTNLDLVAPSSGGINDIISLDIVGIGGSSSDEFNRGFGGTSAACPLAAGIGALMISVNPALTATQIRSRMHKSCDKIGGVTYSGGEAGAGGRHSEYGYGRIDAFQAVTTAALP